MKKLFEKPMFHYTFVLTLVAIVCGLMIGGMNAITAPIIQRNLEEAERKAFQEVLPEGYNFTKLELVDGIPSTVEGAVLGTDQSNKTVGYIYTATDKNGYGSITIVVSVAPNGTILGTSILSIVQTKDIDGTKNNLNSFIGAEIGSSTPVGDIKAGVSRSLELLKSLLVDISKAHEVMADAPKDPYETAYGEGFTLADDQTFTATTTITAKKIAKNAANEVVGYVYYLTGIGDYYDDYNEVTHSGKGISMEVLFDTSYKIVNVIVPEVSYEHTKDYRNNVLSYVQTFIGKTPADYLTAKKDPVAGASYTGDLVNMLLEALMEEVE